MPLPEAIQARFDSKAEFYVLENGFWCLYAFGGTFTPPKAFPCPKSGSSAYRTLPRPIANKILLVFASDALPMIVCMPWCHAMLFWIEFYSILANPNLCHAIWCPCVLYFVIRLSQQPSPTLCPLCLYTPTASHPVLWFLMHSRAPACHCHIGKESVKCRVPAHPSCHTFPICQIALVYIIRLMRSKQFRLHFAMLFPSNRCYVLLFCLLPLYSCIL